nr:TonB C-terminal domain-containing protein [uncultured Desulfobacter sp.]
MNRTTKNRAMAAGVAAVVVICMVILAVFVFNMLLKEDQGKKKRQIQKITLVKPPPPKPKEKLPEPEIKKQEEVIEPEPAEQPPDDMKDLGEDDAPVGDDLGLDADGSGGGDGFGLKAKKGGRSLIDGEKIGGGGSLLRRYSWYTQILQDEIRQKVNKILEESDEIPSGRHRMMLRIRLDDIGNIVSLSVFQSSGNGKVDNIVEQAITGFKISETPPEKMPRAMKIKVTFKS